MGDSPSALFLNLCVKLSQMCRRSILRLNLTTILCREFCGQNWLQTWRYKTRELWGLVILLKLGISKLFTFFVKIRIFCKNSIFLKFDHSLLRMPENIQITLNCIWNCRENNRKLMQLRRRPQQGGGGQGGDNLPLPAPRSPASRTFLFLCLPTPALYCIFPVIM